MEHLPDDTLTEIERIQDELEFAADGALTPDELLSEVQRLEDDIERLEDERADLLDTDFEAKLSIQDRIAGLERQLQSLRAEAKQALEESA
jgi:cell division protein FtsB